MAAVPPQPRFSGTSSNNSSTNSSNTAAAAGSTSCEAASALLDRTADALLQQKAAQASKNERLDSRIAETERELRSGFRQLHQQSRDLRDKQAAVDDQLSNAARLNADAQCTRAKLLAQGSMAVEMAAAAAAQRGAVANMIAAKVLPCRTDTVKLFRAGKERHEAIAAKKELAAAYKHNMQLDAACAAIAETRAAVHSTLLTMIIKETQNNSLLQQDDSTTATTPSSSPHQHLPVKTAIDHAKSRLQELRDKKAGAQRRAAELQSETARLTTAAEELKRTADQQLVPRLDDLNDKLQRVDGTELPQAHSRAADARERRHAAERAALSSEAEASHAALSRALSQEAAAGRAGWMQAATAIFSADHSRLEAEVGCGSAALQQRTEQRHQMEQELAAAEQRRIPAAATRLAAAQRALAAELPALARPRAKALLALRSELEAKAALLAQQRRARFEAEVQALEQEESAARQEDLLAAWKQYHEQAMRAVAADRSVVAMRDEERELRRWMVLEEDRDFGMILCDDFDFQEKCVKEKRERVARERKEKAAARKSNNKVATMTAAAAPAAATSSKTAPAPPPPPAAAAAADVSSSKNMNTQQTKTNNDDEDDDDDDDGDMTLGQIAAMRNSGGGARKSGNTAAVAATPRKSAASPATGRKTAGGGGGGGGASTAKRRGRDVHKAEDEAHREQQRSQLDNFSAPVGTIRGRDQQQSILAPPSQQQQHQHQQVGRLSSTGFRRRNSSQHRHENESNSSDIFFDFEAPDPVDTTTQNPGAPAAASSSSSAANTNTGTKDKCGADDLEAFLKSQAVTFSPKNKKQQQQQKQQPQQQRHTFSGLSRTLTATGANNNSNKNNNNKNGGKNSANSNIVSPSPAPRTPPNTASKRHLQGTGRKLMILPTVGASNSGNNGPAAQQVPASLTASLTKNIQQPQQPAPQVAQRGSALEQVSANKPRAKRGAVAAGKGGAASAKKTSASSSKTVPNSPFDITAADDIWSF